MVTETSNIVSIAYNKLAIDIYKNKENFKVLKKLSLPRFLNLEMETDLHNVISQLKQINIT